MFSVVIEVVGISFTNKYMMACVLMLKCVEHGEGEFFLYSASKRF